MTDHIPIKAKHPPHKQHLGAGPTTADEAMRTMHEGGELRNIAAPNGVLVIPVSKNTIAAEEFLAPHKIAEAIKGLPPAQRQLVRSALIDCLDNTDVCEDGINNEVALHSSARHPNGWVHPDAARHRAKIDLSAAQETVDTEQQREKQILKANSGAQTKKPGAKRLTLSPQH